VLVPVSFARIEQALAAPSGWVELGLVLLAQLDLGLLVLRRQLVDLASRRDQLDLVRGVRAVERGLELGDRLFEVVHADAEVVSVLDLLSRSRRHCHGRVLAEHERHATGDHARERLARHQSAE